MNKRFLGFLKSGTLSGLAGSLVIAIAFTLFVILLNTPFIAGIEKESVAPNMEIFANSLVNLIILYFGVSILVSLLLYIVDSYHSYLSDQTYELTFYRVFYNYMFIFWVYIGPVIYFGLNNLLYMIGSGGMVGLIVQAIIYSLLFSLFGALFFDHFWKKFKPRRRY